MVRYHTFAHPLAEGALYSLNLKPYKKEGKSCIHTHTHSRPLRVSLIFYSLKLILTLMSELEHKKPTLEANNCDLIAASKHLQAIPKKKIATDQSEVISSPV